MILGSRVSLRVNALSFLSAQVTCEAKDAECTAQKLRNINIHRDSPELMWDESGELIFLLPIYLMDIFVRYSVCFLGGLGKTGS